MDGARSHEAPQAVRPDYRHAYPVFGLVAALVATAGGARALAVPATFGQYGFFRGSAPAEARARPVSFQGEERCSECHYQQVGLHDKDAHRTVECEVCHGAAREHALKGTKESAAELRMPRGQEICLGCHGQLAARPGSFPQIRVEQHFAFVGVTRADTPCISCHDPHEPLYMDRDLREARLHPLVHRCRDCHQEASGEAAAARPEDHPPIFECSYCHGAVVADFEERAHGELRCTTCHLFFQVSPFAGRIIRDADPRFCLLCHRSGANRSDDAPPGVEWPKHREQVQQGPEDALKRCVDCHQDQIHAIPDSEAPAPR